MFRVPLAISDQSISNEQFWNSIALFHSNPHLVNKRLAGASEVFFAKLEISTNNYKVEDIFSRQSLLFQIGLLHEIADSSVQQFISNLLEYHNFSFKLLECKRDAMKEAETGQFVSIKILYPKNPNFRNCLEVVVFDKEKCEVMFHSASKNDKFEPSPPFPFFIDLDQGPSLRVCVPDFETADSSSSGWLADVLFPKLLSWAENLNGKTYKESLILIPKDRYISKYQELKCKYGPTLVKVICEEVFEFVIATLSFQNWSENTDPLKYVYEDIAISTYLLLYWEENYGCVKQNFVDLGCGNGLLVYILSEEGHPGIGIDLRRRKIWDNYPNSTNLQVRAITPSDNDLFPEADWIIGNHSDELTPWIPVIAAKSSRKCNFFVLPCCCYEFTGKKYQRKNSAKTQYEEYIEYIANISQTFGFEPKVDRLRIPSTKRICIIGTNRKSEFLDIDINKKLHEITQISGSDEKWCSTFDARLSEEPVRNCTRLDRGLVNRIVDLLTSYLLSEQNFITKHDGSQWNKGRSVHLKTLVELIPSDDLKNLKNQCGGLQTLLKNHHNIFSLSNGFVSIKVPEKSSIKKKKAKTRPCWFVQNHPNSCILSDIDCNYLHK